MSSDDEDFVFYGTPIEREEEIATRKKKAVAEASGQLRTALAPWKQEVTDEEGRRRFHGAFTGGFSAGYYNTVGSKEGWTPQSFTSSRKNRSEVKQQNIYNFLDEDEKSELEGRSLGTSMQFDTFGFTAAEFARKQAEKEQQQRPSTIPGPVPDELIIPATESIGVKLLLKMGWRQGRSVKDSNKNLHYDARREARKAFLALSDNAGSWLLDSKLDEEGTRSVTDLPTDDDNQFTKSMPEYVLNPKQDLYGLGYDPFKHAPEFREKKRLRIYQDRKMDPYNSLSIKGKIGPGFGIGALEELDAEDEDVYASGYDFEDTYVQEIEESSSVNMDNLRILDRKKNDILPGFKVATNSDRQLERFDPPVIPKEFVPHHKFPVPLANDGRSAEIPPPEVPPPEDNNLKILIEGVATLVARCGKLFEDLSREKNQSNPLFSFLSGGKGFDFYSRKLWEERKKRGEQTKLWGTKKPESSEKLTAERRGNILGEKALERSSRDLSSPVSSAGAVHVQLKLSDTFTEPASNKEQTDIRKPFLDDPEKQQRFEQFLKEKYEGGLRTKDSAGSSNMSEAARARERLEFEAAALAIEKDNSVKQSKDTSQLLADLSATAGLEFTPGGIEKDKVQKDEESIAKAIYPKREEFQWRPTPILCKRFDLIDPYMGKPPPAPRMRSKLDSLLFIPDSIKTTNVDSDPKTEQASSSVPQMHNGKQGNEATDNEVEVQNVERPVDLYKAIFSDDSEDEAENTMPNQVEDREKKVEAANTTLNRLIAGDFLESLGKELGLVVPPDLPVPENKTGARVAQQETAIVGKGNGDSLRVEKKRSSTKNVSIEGFSHGGTSQNRPVNLQSNTEVRRTDAYVDKDNMHTDGGRIADISSVGDDLKEIRSATIPGEDKNLITQRTRKHDSSSSSEDERGRKHSRSYHRRKSTRSSRSDSDTSDDDRDRHGSSSKRRKDRGTSREKTASRRHSKHRKHRRKEDSSSESRRSSRKEYHKNRNKKKE